MACNNICTLCRRLIISEAVTFADGTLTINIPAGSYDNGERYCIVVAQTIPAATTITAPVVITSATAPRSTPCWATAARPSRRQACAPAPSIRPAS